MEKYPGHPILTFLQNIGIIITAFSLGFCIYSVLCLFWLKPEDMNVEFTTMSVIVLGVTFVVVWTLTIMVSRKGRNLIAKEKPEKQFRDLQEENKEV